MERQARFELAPVTDVCIVQRIGGQTNADQSKCSQYCRSIKLPAEGSYSVIISTAATALGQHAAIDLGFV